MEFFAGYKMCARLYLNGDGVGKGSHVSLFFVLMKGPYDPILPWPFTHRVTMQLLDQSGQGSHIQEKFKADPNSSSFQQPRSEMNVATGCPHFISFNELERRKEILTRDNTVFIRIIVEWIAYTGPPSTHFCTAYIFHLYAKFWPNARFNSGFKYRLFFSRVLRSSYRCKLDIDPCFWYLNYVYLTSNWLFRFPDDIVCRYVLT